MKAKKLVMARTKEVMLKPIGKIQEWTDGEGEYLGGGAKSSHVEEDDGEEQLIDGADPGEEVVGDLESNLKRRPIKGTQVGVGQTSSEKDIQGSRE